MDRVRPIFRFRHFLLVALLALCGEVIGEAPKQDSPPIFVHRRLWVFPYEMSGPVIVPPPKGIASTELRPPEDGSAVAYVGGRVETEQRRPLAGWHVWFLPGEGPGKLAPPVFRTDADGRFAAWLPKAGRWEVRAAPGYEPNAEYYDTDVWTLDLAEGERRDGIVLVARPALTIHGTVKDRKGQPIEGANVTVTVAVGPSAPAHQTTGADGAFSFAGLAPRGEGMRLWASKEGYRSAQRDDNMDMGSSGLELVLEPLETIQVFCVTEATGETIADAFVVRRWSTNSEGAVGYHPDHRLKPVSSAMGAAGTARLLIDPGSYPYFVDAFLTDADGEPGGHGGGQLVLPWRVQDNAIRISIGSTHVVGGKVVPHPGSTEGVDGCHVVLQRVEAIPKNQDAYDSQASSASRHGTPLPRVDLSELRTHTASVDETWTENGGLFAFDGVLPGRHYVMVYPKGQNAPVVREVVVGGEVAGDPEPTVVALGGGIDVFAEVVDADGKPMPGLKVAVESADEAVTSQHTGGGRRRHELRTDADGRLVSPGWFAGVHRITVHLDGGTYSLIELTIPTSDPGGGPARLTLPRTVPVRAQVFVDGVPGNPCVRNLSLSSTGSSTLGWWTMGSTGSYEGCFPPGRARMLVMFDLGGGHTGIFPMFKGSAGFEPEIVAQEDGTGRLELHLYTAVVNLTIPPTASPRREDYLFSFIQPEASGMMHHYGGYPLENGNSLPYPLPEGEYIIHVSHPRMHISGQSGPVKVGPKERNLFEVELKDHRSAHGGLHGAVFQSGGHFGTGSPPPP